jgi:hypothetical protein
MSEVMCLPYQIPVRNGIKNQLYTRIEKIGRKWMKNYLRRHQEISVKTLEGLQSQERGFSTLNQ